MVEIKVKISENLEKDFRAEVFRKYQLTENGTSLAVEEALKDWVEKEKKSTP